jgi:23S rRNA U2552 (ribose-2'-O)-methylase RlmE/FtsJ
MCLHTTITAQVLRTQSPLEIAALESAHNIFISNVITTVTNCCALQGFDTVLSDMLHFTSGVNDVELSLELAGTAMNVATGHYYDLYGEAFEQQVGTCANM